MLTVHHLNQSRSQRVLWALEELSLPYQIVRYQREKTMLAPPALKKSTRLENRPLLKITVRSSPNPAPSWSICETYDHAGQFKPADARQKRQYRFWLHYAEGSLMPMLLMKLVFVSLGKPPVPFGLRTLGGILGQGVQKRISTRNWRRMRATLMRILPRSPGLPGNISAWRISR